MKFITKTEAITLCHNWEIPEQSIGDACLKRHPKRKRYSFDQSTREIAFLARDAFQHFAKSEQIVLWVVEWGIWPSEEDWNVVNFLRSNVGEEKRALSEAPALVFGRDELQFLPPLIRLCVNFGWGIAIYCDSKEWIGVSHDGWYVTWNNKSL